MFSGNTFDKTMDILSRTMDAAIIRREVYMDNMANVDTPNFKRSEIAFEAELGRAIASEARPTVPLNRSDERHMNPFEPIDYRTAKPRKIFDYLSDVKSNGNNVDADEELKGLLKNQMRYEMMTQIVRFEFGQIKSVLR